VIFVSSKGFIKPIVEKNVDLTKLQYVPNWAEDEYFNSGINNQELYDDLFPKTGFKIMFAGNLGEAQDFESIIKAVEYLRKYEDIYWIIIGDGRKREWIKTSIKEKGLTKNMFMLGNYPMNTMPYFFSKADAMMITLKDEYIFSLTVPAKLQTYMACSKPIVAMINGETAEIIREANAGFTSNAGDYLDFANNVLKMYNMGVENRRSFGINAWNYYRTNFSKDKILDQVEKSFFDFINNR
jgi:glycosyltransferase involved in cell wall biosynthesis